MSNRQPKASDPASRVLYLEPKTDLQRERQRRVLDAIAEKRKRPELSLTAAARRVGTTVKTVRRYAPSVVAIRSGRLDVKSTDRIARELRFLSPKGQEAITVRNSRDASRIARYQNAVRRFLITGDNAQLKKFAGKSVRSGSKIHSFVTDTQTIERLARAGEIHFLDIYASVGGE